MTKAQIENKYGVKIVDDSFWSPLRQKFVKQYRTYSADGNRWSTGMKTIAAVEKDCKEWEKELLSIKANSCK